MLNSHFPSRLLCCLFFFLPFLPIDISGQDRIVVDSLLRVLPSQDDSTQVKLYKALYREYFRVNLDSAGHFAKKAYFISSKSSNEDVRAHGSNLMGIYHFHTSNFDSALVYYLQAHESFRKAGNTEWELNVASNIAVLHNDMGNVEQALQIHLETLQRKEELGMKPEFIASSYWNIGNVLNQIYKYQEAYNYFNKALVIYQKLGLERDIVDIEFQIAGALLDLDSLDKAEALFLKNAAYAKKNNQLNALAEIYDNLGRIYNKQGAYIQAEKYLLEGVDLAEDNGYSALPGQLYRRLTNLYLATNDLTKAEKYAYLSMQNAEALGKSKKVITDYLNLSAIFEQQGRYELALEYYKKYAVQNDSIFGIAKMNEINKIQTEYEKAKKQQEIELLKEKEKRNALEKKGMIGGILALILLSGVSFYAMRQRMISARIAKEKVDQQLTYNIKELNTKKQELTAFALRLAQKNMLLEDLKSDIESLKDASSNKRSVQKIVNTISISQNDRDAWEEFRNRFVAVHKDFEENVKSSYPEVSRNELRLMALLKMNLSNKEIANILNISGAGIKKARYRLRKKLGLETTDSLEELVITL
jgi:tetratricopeptide (TPR) repeat protein